MQQAADVNLCLSKIPQKTLIMDSVISQSLDIDQSMFVDSWHQVFFFGEKQPLLHQV